MTKNIDQISILDVTAENVSEVGIYCIKDKKSPGYIAKVEWFKDKINKGLKIKIAKDGKGKQVGFIEYIPSELAWRPIKADNYLFIQCIAIFVKTAKEKGIGSLLIQQCEQEAKENHKSGICAMSSDGPWIANKTLYEKNKFTIADKLDRFQLMVKSFDKTQKTPCFIDWTKYKSEYSGWHLVYSDQCPWHEKSITDIQLSAIDNGIELTVKKLKTPKEAQSAPSGFGTFSLIKDGKLLADHYISRTRFENILRQEIQKKME
jgi:GNAT superfamily N-acetyltransferase